MNQTGALTGPQREFWDCRIHRDRVTGIFQTATLLYSAFRLNCRAKTDSSASLELKHYVWQSRNDFTTCSRFYSKTFYSEKFFVG